MNCLLSQVIRLKCGKYEVSWIEDSAQGCVGGSKEIGKSVHRVVSRNPRSTHAFSCICCKADSEHFAAQYCAADGRYPHRNAPLLKGASICSALEAIR
jgi:hypothetical protein